MARWLWLLIPALLLLGLLLWSLPREEAGGGTLPPQASPGAKEAEGAKGEATWADRPLEALDPGAVDRVERRGDAYVLHFVDGSQRTVYPFQLPYLPEGLRFRLEYERRER